MESLADLLDGASEKFEIGRDTLEKILALERASLYMKTSRVSCRRKLLEIIQEEAMREAKKT